jgi:HK97 family phage major capsid protein
MFFMTNVNDMRAQRHDFTQMAQAMIVSAKTSGKDLAGDSLRQYETLLAQIRTLDGDIERLSADSADAHGGRGTNGLPVSLPAAATETWKDDRGRVTPVLAKHESFALASPEGTERASFGFGDFVRALAVPSNNPEIRAALSESGGGPAGDYTVPVMLLPQLIDLMRAKTVCIQAGAVTVGLDTETTNLARISADPTPAWRNEAAAFSIADPTFERITFKPQSLGVLVKVSMELLEDSQNINQALLQCFAGAFAVELDRVGLFGTGVAPQPHGIAGTSNVGNISMGTNGALLTNFDPIVNAVAALLNANAGLPTAAIMAPRTLVKASLLKDTLNQPLRKPDMIANLPFLATTSVPINQTQGSSNLASEVILGDFSQLMFGIRHGLRIMVLRERYLADNGQIGFLAELRADVQLRHPQSFCEIVGVL